MGGGKGRKSRQTWNAEFAESDHREEMPLLFFFAFPAVTRSREAAAPVMMRQPVRAGTRLGAAEIYRLKVTCSESTHAKERAHTKGARQLNTSKKKRGKLINKPLVLENMVFATLKQACSQDYLGAQDAFKDSMIH